MSPAVAAAEAAATFSNSKKKTKHPTSGGGDGDGDSVAANKKARRREDGGGADDAPSGRLPDQHVRASCWQHYRSYLDSCDDNDSVGDTDELEELLNLLEPYHIPPVTQLVASRIDNKDSLQLLWLLILQSVAHGILADQCIAEHTALTVTQSSLHTPAAASDDDPTTCTLSKIYHHLTASLTAFPWNASVWSMAANLCRMQNHNSTSSSNIRMTSHPVVIAAAYQRSALDAAEVRRTALAWMEQDDTVDDDESGNNKESVELPLKEWIPLLLLNQVAGVEWTTDEDEDEDDNEKQQADNNSEDDNYNGNWSASSVQATAHFMGAMVQSTCGDHDGALEQLKAFSRLTHRLHPNVWMAGAVKAHAPIATTNIETMIDKQTDTVVAFRHPNGVLPQNLYQRLLQVFAPVAAYWSESSYDHRGYYSYFMDLVQHSGKDNNKPPLVAKNLLEDIIVNHLLPLARRKLPQDKADAICGAEWWVHTRPIRASLGHNLHFDTDEALLGQEKQITHPILSSVLYLTGDQSGGATVVLDQTPNAKEVASHAWVCVPSNNSYLVFPGDRLHGVLPCRGAVGAADAGTTTRMPAPTTVQVSDLFWTGTTSGQQEQQLQDESSSTQQHRLTFMVGFWTRRVPDRIMGGAKLYGPCGPLPPPTDEHTWVRAIAAGYGKDRYGGGGEKRSSATTLTPEAEDIKETPVPTIAPAWEVISQEKADKDNKNNASVEPILEFPRGMTDHRFFVEDAPRCFYDALFECDNGVDGSAEEDDRDEEEAEEVSE